MYVTLDRPRIGLAVKVLTDLSARAAIRPNRAGSHSVPRSVPRSRSSWASTASNVDAENSRHYWVLEENNGGADVTEFETLAAALVEVAGLVA